MRNNGRRNLRVALLASEDLATDVTPKKSVNSREPEKPNQTPLLLLFSSAPTWSGSLFYRPAQAQQQPGVRAQRKTPLKVTSRESLVTAEFPKFGGARDCPALAPAGREFFPAKSRALRNQRP